MREGGERDERERRERLVEEESKKEGEEEEGRAVHNVYIGQSCTPVSKIPPM